MYSNFTCNCNKFTSVYYNIKYRKRICIVAILLISSICATWLLISVAPKSDSVATQVINDFRNNKYEIYKTEIINSDTTYYYRLKQKE